MTDPLVHPAAKPGCAACKGLGLVVVPGDGVAAAVPCACREPVCPTCRGAGYVQDTGVFRAPVRPCACRAVDARAKRFALARIPGRYASATLESLPATTRQVLVRLVLDPWKPGGPNTGVVLHGLVGRGKTHAAIALLRELILTKGASGRFVEFTHLLTDLKMSFEGVGTAADLVAPLYEVDVLLIDELGKGRSTEFEKTVLDDLVSRRYNTGKVILATTNFDPDKPATGSAVANLARRGRGDAEAAEDPSLLDRVDERVHSRLREMCRFVPVIGDDRRLAASAARRVPARS